MSVVLFDVVTLTAWALGRRGGAAIVKLSTSETLRFVA